MHYFTLECVKEIKSALHFQLPMVNNNSLNNTIMCAKSLELCIAMLYVAPFQDHYGCCGLMSSDEYMDICHSFRFIETIFLQCIHLNRSVIYT